MSQLGSYFISDKDTQTSSQLDRCLFSRVSSMQKLHVPDILYAEDISTACIPLPDR